MTQAETPLHRASLERVVRQIVEGFHPQRIILFGSYAYGEPTQDSDADLLVVLETEERPIEVAAQIAGAVDHPFPLDILVRTPAELEAAFQRQSVFVTEILTKGVVLYEAGNEGLARQGGGRLEGGAAGGTKS